jgi:hypothetical protein
MEHHPQSRPPSRDHGDADLNAAQSALDGRDCLSPEAIAEARRTNEAAAVAAGKWTPARRESLRRVVEKCRAFVRCADEFIPDDGAWFHPEALHDHHVEMVDAIDAELAAWGEGEAPAPILPAYEGVESVAFAAPAHNPGARVAPTGGGR